MSATGQDQTPLDQVLVADFGVARAVSEVQEKLTATGMIVGTPTYMSPEQASGDKAIDGRSDVFALACVLYEMLAGEPPFTAPTMQAMIVKRLTEPPPSVTSRSAPAARAAFAASTTSVRGVCAPIRAKTPASRLPSARRTCSTMSVSR